MASIVGLSALLIPISATQDIATDGLAVRSLATSHHGTAEPALKERSRGNGVQ